MYVNDLYLAHHGVKGMKWGVRRYQNKDGSLTSAGKSHYRETYDKAKEKVIRTAYTAHALTKPRELQYAIRKATNRPNESAEMISEYAKGYAKEHGVLPTNATAMKAIETMGIQRHKESVYDNLTHSDLKLLREYTDAARVSRNINTYLATGEPANYADEANKLKNALQKNKIDNLTVYRSCKINRITDGLQKRFEDMGEDELSKVFDQMSKNFNGKKVSENRVFSTSTSPLFAIDTWRSVNPKAAAEYNAYMIINCKGTSGVLADGKTSSGGRIVNTRSNQEAILAPTQLQYRSLAYDKERKMFAITVDAIG